MKKLLFLAAFAGLLLSCGPKKLVVFDELEFEYPGIYKISHQDEDDDLFTAMIDDGMQSTMDFLFLEVRTEDPEALKDADPDILAKYLANNAYELYGIMLPDKDFKLTQGVDSLEVMPVYVTDGGEIEAGASLRGIYFDEDYYGFIYSTTVGDKYRVSAYGQAGSETYLRTLEDIFRSASIKAE